MQFNEKIGNVKNISFSPKNQIPKNLNLKTLANKELNNINLYSDTYHLYLRITKLFFQKRLIFKESADKSV